MRRFGRGLIFPLLVCAFAVVGVFVLPFFFPPAFTAAVSVSNAAGFNNKVAAVAAAACALLVFAVSIWQRANSKGESVSVDSDIPCNTDATMSWGPWVVAGVLLSTVIALAAWQVHASGLLYDGDVGWLVSQMTSNAVYHRSLYSQIELCYGPLLFYPPILFHSALRHWRIPLQSCYFVDLILNQFVGVILLGYVVSRLPLSRNWRIFVLCCFVPFGIQPMLGLNYTWLRFVMPFATLLFCTKQRGLFATSVLLGAGLTLNLATSPEMGVAFAAGAATYSVLQMRVKGPRWALAFAGLPIGAAIFVLLVGAPYFRTFNRVAGGEYNFIVEPTPHVLLYLVALIWLVPRMLAPRIRQFEERDSVLVSFFVICVALTPVALGRCDPGHLFFDGMGIFLLSFVAISTGRRWQQICWGGMVACTLLFGLGREIQFFRNEFQPVLYTNAVEHPEWLFSRMVSGAATLAGSTYFRIPQQADPDSKFDADALATLTHGQPVATLWGISLRAEHKLRERNLYLPDFFFSMYDVFDQRAEEQKVAYLDSATWALIPTSSTYHYSETQRTENAIMGMPLPYRSKQPPYVVGKLLQQDLESNWQPVATFGPYTAYRKRSIR